MHAASRHGSPSLTSLPKDGGVSYFWSFIWKVASILSNVINSSSVLGDCFLRVHCYVSRKFLGLSNSKNLPFEGGGWQVLLGQQDTKL